jgi:hypothetical protein
MFYVYNSWGGAGTMYGTPYSGPVDGLQSELDLEIAPTVIPAVQPAPGVITSFDVTSATPDAFILAGSGYNQCAINTATGGGNNVLDATAGSDFLTGGAGNNSFYLDARNLSTNQWDTIADPHAGDGITIWGVTPADFGLTWFNGQGASSYAGLTADFFKNDIPEFSVTLTGYSQDDLTNGRLAVSYGRTPDMPNLPGSDYLHINVTG